MNPKRRRASIALAASALAVVGAATLSAFHPELHDINPAGSNRDSEITTAQVVGIRTWQPPAPAAGSTAGIRIDADVTYGTREDGTRLDLDVCVPDAATPAGTQRIGIVSIHGGSWARGDKANDDWRRVCQWLASEGFVAFSLNYRLVPAVHFPAAIDDVSTAVEWVRAHAADYGIDPDRIGAFGGSAGANLAALLGTRGEGPLDEGARVAAVAELSGPVNLTASGMADASQLVHRIALDYLDCTDLAKCPQARDASATTFIDSSDPPFFIAHSDAEFIPLGQSQRFADDLAAAGVPATLEVVPGVNHSIGILDANVRAQVAQFFKETLAAPVAAQAPDAVVVPTETAAQG